MPRREAVAVAPSRIAPTPAPKIWEAQCIRWCDRIVEICLLTLLALIPLAMTAKYSALNLKEALAQYTILTAILAFILRSLLVGSIRIPRCPQWIPYGIFLLYSFVSLSFTPAKRTSIRDFILWATFSALLLLLSIYLKEKRFRMTALVVLMASSVLVAFGGNCQYNGFFLNFLPRTPPGSIERTWACSTIGHNNGVAILLMLASFAPLAILLSARRWLVKIVAFITLFVFYFMILICQTRAVWIACPFGLVIFFYSVYRDEFHGRRAIRILLSILGGGMVLMVLASLYYLLVAKPQAGSNIPTLRERISHFSPDVLIKNTRTRITAIATYMIKDRPLIGHGFDSFKYIYPEYQGNYFEQFPHSPLDPTDRHSDQAHNDYLQAWIEMGLPGLVLTIWLFLSHLKFMIWTVKRKRRRREKILLCAAIGASVSILFANVASFEFHVVTSAVYFIFWTGLLLRIGAEERDWVWNLGNYGTIPWLKNLTAVALFWLISFGCLYTVKNAMCDHYYVLGKYYRDSGYRLVEKNEIDQALQYLSFGMNHFRKAIELGPYNGLVIYEQGQLLGKIGEIYYTRKKEAKRAEEYYNASLQALLDTGNEYQYKGLYYVLGKSYAYLYYLKKHPQYLDLAQKNFRQAFRIYPRETNSRDQLARLLWFAGQKEEAMSEWRAIANYDPQFARNYPLRDGIAAENSGVLSSAEQSYSIASRLSLDDLEPRERLARLLIKQGRKEEAYLAYEEYWRTHTDPMPILKSYYDTCLLADDTEQLERVIAKAKETVPLLALRQLYFCYMEREEYGKALETVRETMTLPTLKERAARVSYRHIFDAYWRSGRTPDLIRNWKDARKKISGFSIDYQYHFVQYPLNLPLAISLGAIHCM